MERLSTTTLQRRDIPSQKGKGSDTEAETSERLRPSSVQVLLVGMQGEGGFSLHDPIGIGVVAKRIKTDHPGVKVEQYDTQPELAKSGKIDTDALAERLHIFALKAEPDSTSIIGFGMPIYSVNYTRSVLEKYKQHCEEEPPQGKVEIVLGGSIPTHTNPELVKELFPEAKLVRGEGEERMSSMIQQTLDGEELAESPMIEWADLRNYQGADRKLTKAIIKHGGKPKIETSRGCGHGACTFCSRPEVQIKGDRDKTKEIPLVISGRGGNDYRTIPVETIVKEVRELRHLYTDSNEERVGEILETFTPQSMEDTAEDSFADIEHSLALVSALKAEQIDQTDPLPRIPFGASVRVETFNTLAETEVGDDGTTLLQQLQEVGLSQVFLGVEGGSDAYLKLIAKHQKRKDVEKALAHIGKTIWTDEQGEVHKLNIEMGFITFSWRMNMEMLRENVAFLEEYSPYVSSLFNQLEIRANTIDERMLRESIYGRQRHDGSVYKPNTPVQFDGYDPDTAFNINTSTYEDVPYWDLEVGEVLKKSVAFAQEDESLYYALKSVNRAGSLSDDDKAQAKEFYLRMKALHLDFLKDAAGMANIPNVREKRRELIAEMETAFGSEEQEGILNSVRREVKAFLQEEKERDEAQPEQNGALIVTRDTKDRILLVRPRNQDAWALPGGNINPGEEPEDAAKRDAAEELGVNKSAITINAQDQLPIVKKNGHIDQTTGPRKQLTLTHYAAEITEQINIVKAEADHEIADTLYLSPEDILNDKVLVQKNVKVIAKHFIMKDLQSRHGEEELGTTVVIFE